MAINEKQVEVFMSLRNEGKEQVSAAAKAGFSERTGRRIEKGEHLPGKGRRRWRTRKDPFEAVWDVKVAPLLTADPKLSAICLLERLQDLYPDAYPDKLLRTLQRRVKLWRAQHGPEKEVMFRQEHPPGRLGLSDFTELKGVVVTIQGNLLAHRLFHFRLAFSGWCHVKVILGGESFPALAEGIQEALERLNGAPREHRTDSLSAAFKNLSVDEALDNTERYGALCHHFGMTPSRNNPGVCHENGAIESPHGHFKRRLRDVLSLRSSSDFDSVSDYQDFIQDVVDRFNRRNQAALAEERLHLQPLPATRAVDYTELFTRVTTSSTITVRKGLYSVPSRLIGERLRIHLYDDRLECFVGQTLVYTLPRIYPIHRTQRARRIDYHHLVASLVRKPMAFYHSQIRDDILPDETWRAVWQRLTGDNEPRIACKLIVGALKLAADHDCEQELGKELFQQLGSGRVPSLVDLQNRFGSPRSSLPQMTVGQHSVTGYDLLIPCLATDAPGPAQEQNHA